MTRFKLLREAFHPKESEIKASIRRYLSLRRIFVWNQWQGQFSVKGVPDLVGLLPGTGRLLGIEVKQPGKRPTDDQINFMERINQSGGIAFVATSVDDVIKNLGSIKI